MAKEKAKFSFKDIAGLTDSITKKMPVIRETAKTSKQRGTIGTGIYVLNAAFSADIYGGVPDNRISVLAAPSGTGKSFLCYSIAKQAQAKGYGVIYIDTEYAIELDQLPGYGIDTDEDKFMLIRTNIIEDVKIWLTQMLDSLKEEKAEGKEVQKFIIFLDSVGQLGSRKEVEDAKSGKEKADFTKAKALASLFRIINSDLGYLGIPMVCTNHTYQTMDMYPQDKMKGGEGLFYSASSIAFLTKAKLKTGELDDLDLGQSGLVVTAKMMKNRMAKPKKVKFEISFKSGCNPYIGLDNWCTGDNFEAVGIAKGKMVGERFQPGGNRWYIRHLGKHIAGAELFTPKVFTPEVLDALQPIILEYFRYQSITEMEEIERRLEEAKGDIDAIDDELFVDDMDSTDANALFFGAGSGFDDDDEE